MPLREPTAEQMICTGCGLNLTSDDEVAAVVTYNYAEFAVTDRFCFECRYEISKALNRLHKKHRITQRGNHDR